MTINLNKKIETEKQERETIHVMHILDKLSVSGSGIHGVTKAIEWWIPRFDKQEFKFSVCSLRTPETASEIFERKGIPIHFLSKSKFDLRTLTSLLDLVRREKPHILHLHGYGATNFGRMVSWLAGIPNIVHEHSVFSNQPIYQTLVDKLLSPLTTKALSVSQPVSDFMIRDRKVAPKKLETIIIGLPLTEFRAPERDEVEKKRSELGISPDEHIICNVGRLDIQKGQIYLLKAAALILEELPKTRFLIVGEGPENSNLQLFAQKKGFAKQVIFTGLRNDIPALLALSDIVAIPSLWEGGPLTLFEAMNLQKPVVGTPVGLMGEVIQEGETGFLVPCQDEILLAEKLIFLLNNPDIAISMGQKGWSRCQNYDISFSIHRLEKIYRELACMK